MIYKQNYNTPETYRNVSEKKHGENILSCGDFLIKNITEIIIFSIFLFREEQKYKKTSESAPPVGCADSPLGEGAFKLDPKPPSAAKRRLEGGVT